MKIFISCEKKKSDMNFNQALCYILHTNLINKLVKCVLQYVPKTLNIQRNIFGKIKIIEKTVLAGLICMIHLYLLLPYLGPHKALGHKTTYI